MTVYGFHKLTSTLKSMESVGSDDRYFEGLLTVQMKDKQGEVTIVDELYKVLPVWIDRGAPISDTHTNRIVGKGINYSRTTVKNDEGDELPAIKITGKIFKNYELDNVIWEKIKNNEYKGLSFGGATRSARSPIRMKDGSTAYALGDLEHYEVAVCKDPAVPMAIITDFNQIAKANFNSTVRDDGKMVIQCDNMGCYVNKDSLIKIEDDEDENTQVTILDEWENETHPDKNGKTEGLRTTKSDLLTVMEGDKPENYQAVEEGKSRGRAIDKKNDPCWEGYKQYGMKDKNGKQVPNCVKKAEVTQCAHCNGTGYHGDEKCSKCGGTGKLEVNKAEEDKEKKPLNKPMRDDGDKKFKVYVRDPKTGNIVTVRFGDPNMEIKRDDPERRASFRARHDCDNAKDITTPQYWSCKMWEKDTSVTEYTEKAGGGYADNDNFADPDTSLLLDNDEEKKKFMEKKEMMNAVDDMPDKKDVEKAIEILEKAGYRVDTEDRNNGTEINDTLREKRQFNGTKGTLSEKLPMNIQQANLNESQTFEQKVQALMREGKSRESAEKIVGSFVHKVEASSGSGGAGIGGANLSNGGTLTTDTDGVRNAVYNRKKKKKSRDISDTNAGGVMESAYNQDPPNAQRLNNKSDDIDLDKIIEEETANIKGKKGGGGHRSLATRLTSSQNAKKKAIRDVNKIHALMKLNQIRKKIPKRLSDINDEEWQDEHDSLDSDFSDVRGLREGESTQSEVKHKIPDNSSFLQGTGSHGSVNRLRGESDIGNRIENRGHGSVSGLQATLSRRNANILRSNLEKSLDELNQIRKQIPKRFSEQDKTDMWQTHTEPQRELDVDDIEASDERDWDTTDFKGIDQGKKQSKLGNRKEISHGDSIVQNTSTRSGEISDIGERIRERGHGNASGLQATLSRRNANILRSNLEKSLDELKKLHISGGLGSRGLGSEGGYTQGSGESTQVSNTRKRPEDDRVKVKAKDKYEQGGRYFNSYEVPVGEVPNVEGTTRRPYRPQSKETKRKRAVTRLMGDATQRKVMSNFSNFQNMVNPDKKTIKERKLDEERTNRLYND